MSGRAAPATVLTVGHSSLPLEGFLALLAAHRVAWIGDVRAWPASRRHPHFSREPLAAALATVGIGYRHLPGLGGHRTPRPDSAHGALADPAWRGYADHMADADFARDLDVVLDAARVVRAAVMCAEALPEHCHRSLLADALVARGATVHHLLGPASHRAHVLHPAARIEAGTVRYPASQLALPGLPGPASTARAGTPASGSTSGRRRDGGTG